jgi:spermidine/putrescine transport system permease protein
VEKRRPSAPQWCFALLIGSLILLYLPIFYLMGGSIVETTTQGVELSLRWYRDIFADTVLQEAMVRSLTIAFFNGLISTILGAMAAIALMRSNFRFKLLLESLSMVSLVMPELVFALSLLSWFFIIKLQLSLLTVIIAHVSFTLSFTLLTIMSRLGSLDFSIEEAAQDLGASSWSILWKITLPLLKPALGTSFILGFLMSFDDFLITFFTSGVGSDTLPIKLYASMKIGHTPKLNALSTLMILFSVSLIVILTRSKSFKDLLDSTAKEVSGAE